MKDNTLVGLLDRLSARCNPSSRVYEKFVDSPLSAAVIKHSLITCLFMLKTARKTAKRVCRSRESWARSPIQISWYFRLMWGCAKSVRSFSFMICCAKKICIIFGLGKATKLWIGLRHQIDRRKLPETACSESLTCCVVLIVSTFIWKPSTWSWNKNPSDSSECLNGNQFLENLVPPRMRMRKEKQRKRWKRRKNATHSCIRWGSKANRKIVANRKWLKRSKTSRCGEAKFQTNKNYSEDFKFKYGKVNRQWIRVLQ